MARGRAWWALAVIAGCSATGGSHRNEVPAAKAPVPTATVGAAASTTSKSAASEDESPSSLDSPAKQQAALAEVATACAVPDSNRPGPCTELCDTQRSPCTAKLETLELLARTAEPAARVEAIEVAFKAVRRCDCGDPNEQLHCLPKTNLCERLGWFPDALIDALQAMPRQLQGRVLQTIHERMLEPRLVVPAISQLLKDTVLAANPPTADDALLAHRALVALWRYGTTAQSARGELYAIVAAKPTARLVADALVALAATEPAQLSPMPPPPTPSKPSDGALIATLAAALRGSDHLIQSAAAMALDTLRQGNVDIGKSRPRLAAWQKKADARAAIAARRGPAQVVAQARSQSGARRSTMVLTLEGPFMNAPLAVGTKVSILPAQPGSAEAVPVTSIQTVQQAPGYSTREVVVGLVPARILQGAGMVSPPVAIYPLAPRARSMDIDSVDPALLPAGVNRDGLIAVADVDGDDKPDAALNTCCGGLTWLHPWAEPHPDSTSVYGCMANQGTWVRDSVGWHRVHLLLPM